VPNLMCCCIHGTHRLPFEKQLRFSEPRPMFTLLFPLEMGTVNVTPWPTC
jgi:hypothetical protein